VNLPDFLEDQIGVFSRRELELVHLQSYPIVRMWLNAMNDPSSSTRTLIKGVPDSPHDMNPNAQSYS